jgi:hypothetical protein
MRMAMTLSACSRVAAWWRAHYTAEAHDREPRQRQTQRGGPPRGRQADRTGDTLVAVIARRLVDHHEGDLSRRQGDHGRTCSRHHLVACVAVGEGNHLAVAPRRTTFGYPSPFDVTKDRVG